MPSVPVIKVLVTHRGGGASQVRACGLDEDPARGDRLDQGGPIARYHHPPVCAGFHLDAKKVHGQAVSARRTSRGSRPRSTRSARSGSPRTSCCSAARTLSRPSTSPTRCGRVTRRMIPDQFIPSDLPYACDGPLTLSPADTAARLVSSVEYQTWWARPIRRRSSTTSSAPQGTSLLRASPEPVFAVSAKVWQRSTKLSVAALRTA